MVLPGVPRDKRIDFVENMVKLLLQQGLEGITVEAHSRLTRMVNELLSSTEPVPEPLSSPAEKPGGC